MTFVQRLSYYSGGLVLGIIVVAFFFSGKKSSCDYSPTARVLKNIRIKERYYSPESISYLIENKIDTAAISELFEYGKVNFSESNTKLDSCKTYLIYSRESTPFQLSVTVENCDKKATIVRILKSKQ